PLFRSWHSRGPPGGVVPALQEEEGPRPEGRLLLRQRRRTLDRPKARRGDGLLFGVHHVGRARDQVLLRASRAPPPLKHGRHAGGHRRSDVFGWPWNQATNRRRPSPNSIRGSYPNRERAFVTSA